MAMVRLAMIEDYLLLFFGDPTDRAGPDHFFFSGSGWWLLPKMAAATAGLIFQSQSSAIDASRSVALPSTFRVRVTLLLPVIVRVQVTLGSPVAPLPLPLVSPACPLRYADAL